MSLEENKAIVRRFIEAYNNRNLDLIEDFVAPDYVDHTNKVDREGLKQLMNMGSIDRSIDQALKRAIYFSHSRARYPGSSAMCDFFITPL